MKTRSQLREHLWSTALDNKESGEKELRLWLESALEEGAKEGIKQAGKLALKMLHPKTHLAGRTSNKLMYRWMRRQERLVKKAFKK